MKFRRSTTVSVNRRWHNLLRLVAPALFLLFPMGVWASDDHNGPDQWSIYYGFAEFLLGTGELGDCPETGTGRDRFVVRGTYVRLANVCDDHGERKCDGRLTRVMEWCVADWIDYRVDNTPSYFSANDAHFLRLGYQKGRVRICYSEDGMCDDVDEVARGDVLMKSNNRFFQNPPVDGPTNFDFAATEVSQEIITQSTPFRLDMQRARVRKGTSYGEATSRFNVACIIANDCPIEGSLLHHR